MIKSARKSAIVRLIATAALTSMCAVATAQAQQPAGSVGGPHQGIKLHGHWVIEVRNPDGTLSSRHEFDNSLISSGKSLMAALFGKYAVERWSIALRNLPGNSPCVGTDGTTPTACQITEPGIPARSDLTTNLALAMPLGVGAFPTGVVQLSGHAIVTNPAPTSFFDQVLTTLSVRGPTNAIAATLTSHDLPRITVTPGQILNIVVSFSFS
jgi:hypothetical protein